MMKRFIALTSVLFFFGAALAQSPERVLLWPEGAPGAVGDEEKDRPGMTIYLPDDHAAVGTGVVVLPGGGYWALAMDHEGRDVAEWLNDRGVAAFVTEYRRAPDYGHPSPLQDAQRALRYVRANAERFGIAPDRIGIWGFSAGGHLAATTATHFDSGDPSAAEPLARVSSRPDFTILAYPVMSMTAPYTHEGSRRNLLGEEPDPALAEALSNEKQVTIDTPPAFLFHTADDPGVPSENSVAYYLALRAAGVPAELHIYEHGRHGVGLAPDDPILSTWPDRLEDWMAFHGWLE